MEVGSDEGTDETDHPFRKEAPTRRKHGRVPVDGIDEVGKDGDICRLLMAKAYT